MCAVDRRTSPVTDVSAYVERHKTAGRREGIYGLGRGWLALTGRRLCEITTSKFATRMTRVLHSTWNHQTRETRNSKGFTNIPCSSTWSQKCLHFSSHHNSQLESRTWSQVTESSSLHGWKRKPEDMSGRLRYRRLAEMYARMYTYIYTSAIPIFQRRVGTWP